jgi:hypothetical protein
LAGAAVPREFYRELSILVEEDFVPCTGGNRLESAQVVLVQAAAAARRPSLECRDLFLESPSPRASTLRQWANASEEEI